MGDGFSDYNALILMLDAVTELLEANPAAFRLSAHPAGTATRSYVAGFAARDGSQKRHGLHAPLNEKNLAGESYMTLIELLTYLRVRCNLTYTEIDWGDIPGATRYLTWMLGPALLVARFALESAGRPPHTLVGWTHLAGYLPLGRVNASGNDGARDLADMVRAEPLVRTLSDNAVFEQYTSMMLHERLLEHFTPSGYLINIFSSYTSSSTLLRRLCNSVEAASVALVKHHDVHIYLAGVVQVNMSNVMARIFARLLTSEETDENGAPPLDGFQQMDRFALTSAQRFVHAHRDAQLLYDEFMRHRNVALHAKTYANPSPLRTFYQNDYLPHARKYGETAHALFDAIGYFISQIRTAPSYAKTFVHDRLLALRREMVQDERCRAALLILGYHQYLGVSVQDVNRLSDRPYVFMAWIINHVLPFAFTGSAGDVTTGQFAMERMLSVSQTVSIEPLIAFSKALEARDLRVRDKEILARLPRNIRPYYAKSVEAQIRRLQRPDAEHKLSSEDLAPLAHVREHTKSILMMIYRVCVSEGLEKLYELRSTVRCDVLVQFLVPAAQTLLEQHQVLPELVKLVPPLEERKDPSANSLRRREPKESAKTAKLLGQTFSRFEKRIRALEKRQAALVENSRGIEPHVRALHEFSVLSDEVQYALGVREENADLRAERLLLSARKFFTGFCMLTLMHIRPLDGSEGDPFGWRDTFFPDGSADPEALMQEGLVALRAARSTIGQRQLDEAQRQMPLRFSVNHRTVLSYTTVEIDLVRKAGTFLKIIGGGEPMSADNIIFDDLGLKRYPVGNARYYAPVENKKSVDVMYNLLRLLNLVKYYRAKPNEPIRQDVKKYLRDAINTSEPSRDETLHVLGLFLKKALYELLTWEMWIVSNLMGAGIPDSEFLIPRSDITRVQSEDLKRMITNSMDVALAFGREAMRSAADTPAEVTSAQSGHLTVADLEKFMTALRAIAFYNASGEAIAEGRSSSVYTSARIHGSMALASYKAQLENPNLGAVDDRLRRKMIQDLKDGFTELTRTIQAYAVPRIADEVKAMHRQGATVTVAHLGRVARLTSLAPTILMAGAFIGALGAMVMDGFISDPDGAFTVSEALFNLTAAASGDTVKIYNEAVIAFSWYTLTTGLVASVGSAFASYWIAPGTLANTVISWTLLPSRLIASGSGYVVRRMAAIFEDAILVTLKNVKNGAKDMMATSVSAIIDEAVMVNVEKLSIDITLSTSVHIALSTLYALSATDPTANLQSAVALSAMHIWHHPLAFLGMYVGVPLVFFAGRAMIDVIYDSAILRRLANIARDRTVGGAVMQTLYYKNINLPELEHLVKTMKTPEHQMVSGKQGTWEKYLLLIARGFIMGLPMFLKDEDDTLGWLPYVRFGVNVIIPLIAYVSRKSAEYYDKARENANTL